MEVGVYRVGMESPYDTSGIDQLIVSGQVDPRTLICAIGKTEGNGGANDFTRGYATLSCQLALARFLPESPRSVIFGWSGGTEGILSPHVTLFTRRPSTGPLPNDGRLVVGSHVTRAVRPEEIGTKAQALLVAEAVERAMADGGVAQRSDVHLVFVKGPLLTMASIAEARTREKTVASQDPNQSKGLSRGAMALGVAMALGEVDGSLIQDADIGTRLDLYSEVALTSAGGELSHCEVLLFANSQYASGDYRIGHGVIRDAMDLEGVLDAVHNAGLDFDGLPGPDVTERIVAVFAKGEAGPDGHTRGFRHTMLSDADIHYERHARAAVGTMIAAVTKNPQIFVSGGTEHQCARGHAPIAVIVKMP